ncbi:ATP-binding cassette domain-containing protein [Isoalcanivorax indicus]|uniref:ATP-binding cassette domain-containing protein n=1 Tax=Isoalcanivorax indicus TaxID=2202653 RepID=UPI000DBA2FAB|nr:ATP-binding cassette domain-containing protein [Isoalcanivorax indicus]
MSDPVLLQVTDLEAGYQRPLVGPLSFTLHAGRVLVLQGANGAGKSTVLRALTGEARCFAGHIERPGNARLACQPQHSPLPVELPMTVREYLRLADARPETLGGLPARLAVLMDARLDHLSGGQWQLLRVFATLCQPAPLILLDEPTNNLDPDGEALLVTLLGALAPERAVLLVCHEADFVANVAREQVEIG